MRANRNAVIQIVFIGVSVMMLGWLLWGKLQVGLLRYFDADEMAYLHWAHNVFMGRVPYRDFLSYVPPGFYYALAPLYWFSQGTEILFTGRVYAFVVFLGITFAISYLFWLVRKSWVAIVAGIVLAFIPIPADKFIEIRPDNLAMLIALLGSIFHVIAFEQYDRRRYWFISGVFYMSALLILPKVVPQTVAAGFVMLCWVLWGERDVKVRMRMGGMFVLGVTMPLVVFGIWAISVIHSLGDLGNIWYSLAMLPIEVNKIGVLFPMQPYQFFYPNTLLYGAPGWTTVLVVNHAMWLVGLLMGTIRLVTPVMPNGKKGTWAELLIGFSFLGYISLFIYGYPMRHEQYLIPIGIFIAFYAADSISIVWMKMKDHGMLLAVFVIGFGSILSGLFQVSVDMNREKNRYTNAGDYEILKMALRTIPSDAYVFDLVGSTIYFRDPYYVSAVPFGQWEPYLSHPLPSVKEALVRTNTSYIYEGQLKRVSGLSIADQAYITSSFRPFGNVSGLLYR